MGTKSTTRRRTAAAALAIAAAGTVLFAAGPASALPNCERLETELMEANDQLDMAQTELNYYMIIHDTEQIAHYNHEVDLDQLDVNILHNDILGAHCSI